MEIESFAIRGPLLIRGVRHHDSRGFFSEIYVSKTFEELGLPEFVQDNLSLSAKNVVRGLHWQESPHAQGKLVTCLSGSIIDFIVDIRPESPTYLSQLEIPLGGRSPASAWVPSGFAHGFVSLEENTLVTYKVTNFWNKESERGINPFQMKYFENLNTSEFVISEKDSALGFLDRN